MLWQKGIRSKCKDEMTDHSFALAATYHPSAHSVWSSVHAKTRCQAASCDGEQNRSLMQIIGLHVLQTLVQIIMLLLASYTSLLMSII